MSADREAGRVARLLEAWDGVDSAAQRVATALPAQMTEAAGRLERERLAFRALLQRFAQAALRSEEAARPEDDDTSS